MQRLGILAAYAAAFLLSLTGCASTATPHMDAEAPAQSPTAGAAISAQVDPKEGAKIDFASDGMSQHVLGAWAQYRKIHHGIHKQDAPNRHPTTAEAHAYVVASYV